MRLRGSDQLLAVLPQLIGYQIDHSVVVVVSRLTPGPGRQVCPVLFTGRLDLPPTDQLGALVGLLRTAVRQAVAAADGVKLLSIFGYDLPTQDGGAVDPAAVDALLAAARRLADETGAHVHDLMLVRDGARQLCEVVSSGEDVRPADRSWVPVPRHADVPAAADLVLEGRVALPSRGDVVELVRRRDEQASRASDLALSVLTLATDRLDQEQALRALGDWTVHGTAPSARERAWIAALLQDRWVRDAVLARWLPELGWLDDGDLAPDLTRAAAALPPLPAGHCREQVERLLGLVGEVPRDLGTPLLTLVGLICWVRGDGTLANEACDLALEIEPDYRMALLLRRALEAGMRPPRQEGGQAGRTHRHPGGRPAA